MNEVTVELKRRSDTFQFSALESAHNIMDYFEDNLEVVMLPPSEGKTSADIEGRLRSYLSSTSLFNLINI